MALGGVLGSALPVWPPLEIAVGLSAIALGIWAFAFSTGAWAPTAVVLCLFALIHGVPHGWELSARGPNLLALAGAALATAALSGIVAAAVNWLPVRATRLARVWKKGNDR